MQFITQNGDTLGSIGVKDIREKEFSLFIKKNHKKTIIKRKEQDEQKKRKMQERQRK